MKSRNTPEKDCRRSLYSLGQHYLARGQEVQVVLGEKDGHYDARNQLVFSPNDDGSYDKVKLNAVVLRNVDTFT